MKRKKQDELTEKMHSELQIDDETDFKFTVWFVLDDIESGSLTKAEAFEMYGVTESDLEKYRPEWEKEFRE